LWDFSFYNFSYERPECREDEPEAERDHGHCEDDRIVGAERDGDYDFFDLSFRHK
jgi:hypothetical protein